MPVLEIADVAMVEAPDTDNDDNPLTVPSKTAAPVIARLLLPPVMVEPNVAVLADSVVPVCRVTAPV